MNVQVSQDSSCTLTQSFSTEGLNSRRNREGQDRQTIPGFRTRFPNLPENLPSLTLPEFAKSKFEVGESSGVGAIRGGEKV